MGNSEIYPDATSPKQTQSLKIYKSPRTSPSQRNYTEKQQKDNEEYIPITIPCFMTKQSPFKFFIQKQHEEKHQLIVDSKQQIGQNTQQKIKVDYSQSDGNTNNQCIKIKQQCWTYILYDKKTIFTILDYLQCSEIMNVSKTNHRMQSQVYFYQLLHRQNNWDFTFYQIQLRSVKHSKNVYQKLVNQSVNQQSQHSLDLDRLQSLFIYQQDNTKTDIYNNTNIISSNNINSNKNNNINQQLNRVDKIMKALSISNIEYFQGLNSIIIILVSLFNDQISYWLTILLIQKAQNIQNNSKVYQNLIVKIERQIKLKCNKLYKKLQQADLDVQYFAMKWIMGLFSTDLNRQIIIFLWDLIINFGLAALEWFIVSLFKCLQHKIIQMNGDQLNNIFKSELKTLINTQIALELLQLTRIYVLDQLYGEGSAQVVKLWNTNSIKYDKNYLPQIFHKYYEKNSKSINITNQICPIDESQLQLQQQQQQKDKQQQNLQKLQNYKKQEQEQEQEQEQLSVEKIDEDNENNLETNNMLINIHKLNLQFTPQIQITEQNKQQQIFVNNQNDGYQTFRTQIQIQQNLDIYDKKTKISQIVNQKQQQ